MAQEVNVPKKKKEKKVCTDKPRRAGQGYLYTIYIIASGDLVKFDFLSSL